MRVDVLSEDDVQNILSCRGSICPGSMYQSIMPVAGGVTHVCTPKDPNKAIE